MPVSQFSDVEGTDPQRLAASLRRRADAVLYEPYRRSMYASLAAAPEGMVVDVGAGIGDALAVISRSRLAVGVEPSPTFCRIAAERGLHVVQGSAEALPFRSGVVSGLLMERVLQHVPDVESALDEARRVIAPGGVLVAADPVHSQVRLEVEGFEGLPEMLCDWRSRSGLAAPDAAERALGWAAAERLAVRVEVFVCDSSTYPEARALTNFPEWARLAREDGLPVTSQQFLAWEEHFSRAAAGEADFRLVWPVQVAVIAH